jgi:hypothetical protein
MKFLHQVFFAYSIDERHAPRDLKSFLSFQRFLNS